MSFLDARVHPGNIDALTAAKIGAPGSATAAALNTKIDTKVTDAISGIPPARQLGDASLEGVAGKLDMRSGDIVMTLAGDSTGNDANEWYRLWCIDIAAQYPHLRVEYFPSTAGVYASPIIVQAGVGYVPAGPATTVSDTFTRTGELSGSTPSTGLAWSGSTGRWSTDGSHAVCVASGAAIVSGGATSSKMTTTATGVVIDTTANASGLKQLQVHTKYVNSQNNIYAYVNVSTTGVVTWGLLKRIANVATTITTGTGSVIPNLTPFNMAVTVDGLNVSATVAGETITGTLAAGDDTALSGATSMALVTTTAQAAGIKVDSVTLAADAAAQGQKLSAYNASQAGSTLQYQLDRLDVLLAVEPDVLLMSSGHNYTTGNPTDYLTSVNAFVTAALAKWPKMGVVASSQNPVYGSVAYGNQHKARFVALRKEAIKKGWGYLPIMETYLALPDGGAQYVTLDGIHPDSAGQIVWAAVPIETLKAKSFRV